MFSLLLVATIFGSTFVQSTFFPDPKSCNKFYIQEGSSTPILTSCPKALHFNPVKLICEDPSLAKCKVRF